MDFDFTTLAFAFGALSLAGIGVILAGSFLFPEQAERYKRMIPNVIIGLILVASASFIIGALGG
jgi:hypothetical protein